MRDAIPDPAGDSTSWLGLYGKLPSYGDFVQGGLPDAFVQDVDSWLSRALAGSRDRLGASWKEHYLASPLWRFGLDAGIARVPVVGVLAPSTDEVGRCFPLVIAAAGHGDAVALAYLGAPWFDAVERLAFRALEETMSKSDVLDALVAIGDPEWPDVVRAARVYKLPHATVWTGEETMTEAVDFTRPVLTSGLAGDKPVSLWWTNGSERIAPAMALCETWPTAELYTAFLSGTWQQTATV